MGTLIGVTGTPGTGKKSIAPLVAAGLGVGCIPLPWPNARSSAPKGTGEREIDLSKERDRISKDPPSNAVVYGHLLPYLLPKAAVKRMVVLRCEPLVLRARLSRRGYQSAKTKDNVEAELIGLIANDAYEAFGLEKTLEYDTTASTAPSAARAIIDLVSGKALKPTKYDWILNYQSPGALTSLLRPDAKRRG